MSGLAGRLAEHVPLAARTTLGVGGSARWLGEALDVAALRGAEVVPLGAGSNVVVADEGLHALVLVMAIRGLEADVTGGRALLRCGAGEPWARVVEHAVARGWAGLECLAGIPGLVGATPIQNVGAYGQQVSDTIVSVRALERATGRVVELPASRCGFAYRDSVFRGPERDVWIVLGVTFSLLPGGAPRVAYAELARQLDAQGLDHPTLGQVRDTVVELRRRKAMVLDPDDPDTRSAGSFFVNPVLGEAEADAVEERARALGVLGPAERAPRFAAGPGTVKLAAAWLIERAGFRRGTREGGAAISSRHALALVNRDAATAADVLALARRVRRGVLQRFGVMLRPEPALLGCTLED